ncbi:hypothetical protein DUF77 [Thermacetogenium phaeum DSM 12270]|uniref:Thiamine-binding protein domain-containing protein n=1 Tax=Thermacetogenium phaeum (strain ATCC BAA-254 / DSM 26808 / PB) TaxID=1089553 RepID=K4LU19_THEPS|nr:MTH1187 family thiamine-binding protein [Thermacetogenium phaeum]AFV11529.1 hypothetical protein DUF77 [Thermacetogenium phaeum DSM 12270]
MPLLEISVVPVGTGQPSFSSSVTDAVRTIERRGLNYQITPTATVIEGDLEELMEVAKEIHQNALGRAASRVITNITIDDRIDKDISLQQQVETVKQSLNDGAVPELRMPMS